MSNQKPGQLVVTPGAKFDKNQIGSPVGLFNPDGSEFVGGEGGSATGGGWQAAPPYQNMVVFVTDTSVLEALVLSNDNPFELEEGWHLHIYDGNVAKIFTATGAQLPMEFDETIQPKVDDTYHSRGFIDARVDPRLESGSLRLWYNGNDNGVGAPHYWVIEGEIKAATDANTYMYTNDVCAVDVSENITIACIVNPDQPSNTFIFNRVDDGTYNAVLSGVVVDGNASPEVPFGFSILKDLTGEGAGYKWIHGGAGKPTATVGVGLGTDPSGITIVGTDQAGKISVTTGVGCTTGQVLNVTLGNAIPTGFVVELSAVTEDTLGVMPSIFSAPDLPGGTNWDLLISNTPLDDETTYSWFYSIRPY